MFCSIIFRGLPKECGGFTTVVNFKKETKSSEEIKRDVVNFDNENVKKVGVFSTMKNANVSIYRKLETRLMIVTKKKHRTHKCKTIPISIEKIVLVLIQNGIHFKNHVYADLHLCS